MIGYVILILLGIASGIFVAGGLFAFVTMIGVVQRMAVRSKTAKHAMLYEDVVIIGGSLGNLFYMFNWGIPGGYLSLILYGWFSGFYVGCLAFALAETLNVLPLLSKRVKLTIGLPYVILVFAIGKLVGSLVQFLNS